MTGRVTGRALAGPDGKTVRVYDENPILNSIVYEVEFPDGQVKEFSANGITEDMLSHINLGGYSLTLMEVIIIYNKDKSVAFLEDKKYVITKSGL